MKIMQINSLYKCKTNILLILWRRKHHYYDHSLSKHVIISKSNDIFSNLALEDWLFKNYDFKERGRKILLWRNNPAVVMGRHQNPWTECQCNSLPRDVCLARRNSGGGTVFHDLGNLNICFMSHKDLYDRKENLHLICNALNRKWNLGVKISEREDLIIDRVKISGTASKLSRPNAYHHCTLLFNVDLKRLHHVLRKDCAHIRSKATSSVPSVIMNINSIRSDISYESLVDVISEEYCKTFKFDDNRSFVEPDERILPGFDKIRSDLTCWDWVYGKTPNFTVTKRFRGEMTLKVTVYHGRITDLTLNPSMYSQQELEVIKGCRYEVDSVSKLMENIDQIHLSPLFKQLLSTIKTT